MTKITFIGAGSMIFTRNLVRDLLTFPLFADATLCLMDINPERLEFANRCCQKIIDMGGYRATVVPTLDRVEALRGADVVLVTIRTGDFEVWRHDIEIPKKYGVDFNIGDTRGTSGIFRALRTIPVMVSIVKDMERYCPNAIMLNYTNPMAMLCRAMQRESFIQLTGLCHSVQGTAMMLAKWIGAPDAEITYTCAGINHQAFYLKFEWNGQDAYPLLRAAVEKPEVYNEEIVRNEMFKACGYFVTESSGHNSEYNWWFRKRQDLIEKYCLPGTGWNPGEYAYSVKRFTAGEDTWKETARQWFSQETPISLERGHEYAAHIASARLGGEVFSFNGNVPNTGLIPNLPPNACVEVPVFVDRAGFHPVHVGPLPTHLAALNHLSISIEELTVEAALSGDPTLVYYACCYDPLAASVLSLAEIRQMVNEMLVFNQPYLPQFKHFQV
jgi:alpha-galactosidase